MAQVQIKIAKTGAVIDVDEGANLMEALLEAGLPVASSCGGEGVCGKCHVKIVDGVQNLSKETSNEKELKEVHDVHKSERISCQTAVLGPITVTTTYW